MRNPQQYMTEDRAALGLVSVCLLIILLVTGMILDSNKSEIKRLKEENATLRNRSPQ